MGIIQIRGDCMRLYDVDMVKQIAKEKGYELISKEYNNPKQKLILKDEYGYKYSLTISQLFKNNNYRKVGKQNPFSIENIQLWINLNKVGYEILYSNTFLGTHKKLDFKCNNGHDFQMAWADFQGGQRCPMCKVIKNADRCRKSYNEVKKYIEDKNYKLLSKHYTNNAQKLKILCKLKNILLTIWNIKIN